MLTPSAALSLSSEVEKIGAYAGFAAVIGLAVLSLLYFASAREVKRLREWADRAPERVADLEARVGDLVRQRAALPQPVSKAAPAKPGAKPATAAATAAAKPEAKAAAANGDAKDAAKPPAVEQPASTPAEEDGAPAVFDVVEEAPGDLTEIKRPDGKAPAKEETLVSPGAGRALRQNKPSARPRTQPPVRPSTARLMESARASNAQRVTGGPPPGAAVPPDAAAEGHGRRRIAMIGGGVLAGIVVLVVLVTQVFTGGDSQAPKSNRVIAPTNTQTSDSGTVDRAATTVAVFNGTSFQGLAKGVADKISEGGFTRGEVRNAIDNTRAATIVEYTEGNKPAALEVARTIDVGADAVAAVDAGTRALAPNAQVIVTVGADQNPTTTG